MNCYNCKKEVDSTKNNYCVYCGEKLKTSKLDQNCTSSRNNEELIKNVQEGLKDATKQGEKYGKIAAEKGKELFKKNKKYSFIGIALILLIIIGIGGVSWFKGKPVSESKIEEYVIGRSINVDGNSIIISESNFDKVEITDRQSKRSKFDYITGTITIKLPTALVSLPVNMRMEFDKDNGWNLYEFDYDINKVNITPTQDPKDVVEELIKSKEICHGWNNFKLDSDMVKEISNIEITEEKDGKKVAADVLLSNGLVNCTMKVSGDMKYSLGSESWEITDRYLESKIQSDVKLSDDITDESLKEFVLNTLEEAKYTYCNCKENSYGIYLQKDSISDLKVKNHILTDDGKSIRLELEGSLKNGVINNITFQGVTLISTDLYSNDIKNLDVDISDIQTSEVDLDILKKSMLDKRIKDTLITLNIADTFEIVSQEESTDIFTKKIIGKMTAGEKTLNVSVRCRLEYLDNTNTYAWKVDWVDSIEE